MPCINLGSWSSVQANPVDACGSSLSITVYGDSFSVGTPLYTDPSCNNLLSAGFYSNGVVAFQYLGGFRYFTSCNCSDTYCVDGTTTYDDTYEVAGTYNNEVYFLSQSSSYYIYYNLTNVQWCLSSSLGGTCDLWGPFNSFSPCPDFDSSFFSEGECSTPITPDPCEDFNFEAVFECFSIPPPDVSSSPTPTPTPTPTPSPSNPCGGFSVSISGMTISSSPTPTPTPTPTPSPDVTRPCNFSGSAIFNGVSERIICGDSKKFTDCFTGFDYFTTQSLLDPFNSELLQGYVYEVIVNGEKICAIYDGLVQNISGIDNIEITGIVGNSSEGACLDCIVVTPTPVYNCLVVHSECTTGGTGTINVNPGTIINGRPSYTFSLVLLVPYTIFSCTIYWDDINVRWVVEDSTNNIAGAYLYSDIPTPIGSVSEWISQPISIPTLNCITTSAGFYTTELTVPCPSPSVTPTPTPTPTPNLCITSTYLLTNNSPGTQEIILEDCDGNQIDGGAPVGDSYWCSAAYPVFLGCPSCVVTLVSNDCNQNCCDQNYPLPQIGSSTVINGVILNASGSGDIINLGPTTFTPACYTNPITVSDIIEAGSQSLGPWSYTINFNNAVNNVRIRLIDYTFRIDLVSGTVIAFESVQFTTNLGSQPTVTPCNACCYQIVGNSVQASNLPGCVTSNQVPNHSGTGIFVISASTPFTSLTIQSIQTSSLLGGVKFDICGFDVDA